VGVTQFQLENLLGKRFSVKPVYRWKDSTKIGFEQISGLF
jgi:hypothetical protein